MPVHKDTDSGSRQLFHCECFRVIGTSDSDPTSPITTQKLMLLLISQYIEGIFDGASSRVATNYFLQARNGIACFFYPTTYNM